MRHADRPESIEPTSACVPRKGGVGSPADNGGAPAGRCGGAAPRLRAYGQRKRTYVRQAS